MPPSASSRPLWALTVFFGLAAIGFVVWFMGVIPPTGCTGPAQPGVSALLEFQMARTPADMEAVFGREGDPCRAGMVAALDRANTVDLSGFIATYGAFLVCFLLAMMRAGGGAAARVGLVAAVAGLALDVLETTAQLRLTRELPGSAGALQALAIGSTGKYAALSVTSLCAGIAMIARRGLAGILAGVVCIVAAGAALVGLVDPASRAFLGTGTGIAWTVMLLYAVGALLRGDRARHGSLA